MQRATYRPRTKSYVKKLGVDDEFASSPARRNLRAAANSMKPITTLPEFSQLPLLGIFLSSVGNRARKKNGAAKVAEKATPPRMVCHNGRCTVADVPLKPPRNGATQAKLMIVKVSAMKTVPAKPPL